MDTDFDGKRITAETQINTRGNPPKTARDPISGNVGHRKAILCLFLNPSLRLCASAVILRW
jgi:hypothetical protein